MLQAVFLYCRPHELRLWIITGPVKAKLGHFFILSLTLNQTEFYANTPGYVSQNKLSMRSMNQLKVP